MVVLRIDQDRNMRISGNVYTKEYGFDDSNAVDDTKDMEGINVDDSLEAAIVLASILGITSPQISSTELRLTDNGSLIVPGVVEHSGTGISINQQKTLVLAGALIEEGI